MREHAAQSGESSSPGQLPDPVLNFDINYTEKLQKNILKKDVK